MPEPAPGQSSEEEINLQNSAEQSEEGEKLRTIRERVACVDKYYNMDQMLQYLRAASEEGPVDVFALAEYKVKLPDFLSRINDVKQFVQEKRSQLIVAPEAMRQNSVERLTWEQIKQLLDESMVNYNDDLDNDERIDSVGFYISPEQTYAFPKTMNAKIKKPLHVIPNTRIGVIICGEIHDCNLITDEVKDIDIIFNPSSEGDDPYLKYRMLREYGKRTEEEVRQAIEEDDPYITVEEANKISEQRLEPEQIEILKEYGEWDQDEDEHKTEWTEMINRILKSVMSEPRQSPYAESLSDNVRNYIPVIRTDGRATGLLNDIKGINFSKVECKKHHCYFDFSFTKK